MAKAKAKKSSKRAAPATAGAIDAISGAPVHLQEGDRVRARTGDWGNSRGTVIDVTANGAFVIMDTAQRTRGPVAFAFANLVKL